MLSHLCVFDKWSVRKFVTLIDHVNDNSICSLAHNIIIFIDNTLSEWKIVYRTFQSVLRRIPQFVCYIRMLVWREGVLGWLSEGVGLLALGHLKPQCECLKCTPKPKMINTAKAINHGSGGSCQVATTAVIEVRLGSLSYVTPLNNSTINHHKTTS